MQHYTIVFDLDGTLIETAPDLVRATNHALAHRGLSPVDDGALRPTISFGGRAMVAEGLRLHGVVASAAETDELMVRFHAFYGENIAVGSRPFPGLESALDTLAAAGARLAVCTNKQERPSRQLLDALGLTGRFQAIAGRDTFPVYKPHPDHLTGAIRLAGGLPGRAIMVGDSDTDVKTARAAGVPVIGVPFGYTDVPMSDLGPDALITHYDELADVVRRLIGKSADV